MTSMLCVKSLDGSMKVHDRDGVEEMLTIGDNDIIRTTFMPRPHQTKKQNGCCSYASSVYTPHNSPHLPMSSTTLKGRKWLSSSQAKDIQMNQAKQMELTHEQNRRESDIARDLYGPILESENTFVQDVHQYLDEADTLALRKKELLHKTWSSQVYKPIRRKILQVMNTKEFANKDRRHRELYRQYLEYANKKGHVFLDTMDKGEYYAQALNGHRPAPITVKTSALQDPLLLQGRERNREEQTILRYTTGEIYSLNDIEQIKLPPLPLVPLGRHSANCVTWLEMPLGNISSTPRKASRLRMKGNCTRSQIDFGHPSKPSVEPHVINQELKSQKKRMFVNTPPFNRPPKPVLKPPYACCSELTEGKMMCPVSA